MGRILKSTLYAIAILFLLAGCSDQEETVEWVFFSEITSESGEQLKEKLQDQITDFNPDQLDIRFNAAVYERLIGEIAAHEGNILFIEADMVTPATFDTEGLIPLNSAVEEGKDIPAAYKEVDPDTGEENIYVLPIDENSVLMDYIGVDLNKPLVALVPIYSDYHDVSIKALKELSKTK